MSPAPAPANPPEPYPYEWAPSSATSSRSPAKITTEISPPLIAMVAVVGTAFLIVVYARILSRYLRRIRSRWRRWRRRRRLLRSTSGPGDSDLDSPPPGGLGGGFSFGSSSDFFLSPYGLDDSAIKALPLSLFSAAKAKQLAATNRDCAVCLLEFEDDDSLRTLPLCFHAFHVDCIDVWLRSHATCPLCRAAVLRQDSPFVPMRASRIRPSFDDLLLDSAASELQIGLGTIVEPLPEIGPAAASPPPSTRTDDHSYGPRDFLFKRSYSFSSERCLAADRMMLEPSTASPWRYRYRGLWSKRWASPFSGVGGGGGSSSSVSRAARVFSFRSYRGVAAKSPFFRRRGSFFPLSSEPGGRRASISGPSCRRSRSMTSPSAIIFMRPTSAAAMFLSSRTRCGDPEALLSPDRLSRG